ncbi:MAG: hypothetical protein N2449_01570 [Bacteroidales bacterium]|nr:hypothetical protein [Bacteroidales bacterium]
MKPLKNLLSLLISLIISYAVIVLFNIGYEWLLFIPIYFFLITYLTIYYLALQQKKNQRLYIISYLSLTMIRLFIHIAIMVLLFIFTNAEYLIASLFLCNYIVYNIFELSFLLKKKKEHTH